MTSNDWLEIRDDGIDANAVARQVEEHIATHHKECREFDAESVSQSLWEQHIGRAAAEMILTPSLPEDGDIYPYNYVIDWRIPILGPLNSIVRRVINLEIKRYLDPALRKQSRLNRQFREVIIQLMQENQRLQRELILLKAQSQTKSE